MVDSKWCVPCFAFMWRKFPNMRPSVWLSYSYDVCQLYSESIRFWICCVFKLFHTNWIDWIKLRESVHITNMLIFEDFNQLMMLRLILRVNISFVNLGDGIGILVLALCFFMFDASVRWDCLILRSGVWNFQGRISGLYLFVTFKKCSLLWCR